MFLGLYIGYSVVRLRLVIHVATLDVRYHRGATVPVLSEKVGLRLLPLSDSPLFANNLWSPAVSLAVEFVLVGPAPSLSSPDREYTVRFVHLYMVQFTYTN